jgi:hypothetical protein
MTARYLPTWRLFLSLLALIAQLSIGASVPAAPAFSLAGGSIPICHGGEDPVDAPAPHRPADCVLCPLCIAMADHSVMLGTDGQALPAARMAVIGLAAPPPPSTAPPPARRYAAQPRAPPSEA